MSATNHFPDLILAHTAWQYWLTRILLTSAPRQAEDPNGLGSRGEWRTGQGKDTWMGAWIPRGQEPPGGSHLPDEPRAHLLALTIAPS
jgi:hypothetical protein